MTTAESFIKAKKKEAMASLELKTQPQLNQWLKAATESEILALATALGYVEQESSQEEAVEPVVLSLEGMETEIFMAKDGTAITILRLPITRTAAVTQGPSKGQIIVVCELEGIGEVIVRNNGHLVSLVREGIDMIGYRVPIALNGTNPLTRRAADFNGVAQFDGRVVESADDNLITFATAQREEAQAIAMLTTAQQADYHAQKNATKVAATIKAVNGIKTAALAAFKK